MGPDPSNQPVNKQSTERRGQSDIVDHFDEDLRDYVEDAVSSQPQCSEPRFMELVGERYEQLIDTVRKATKVFLGDLNKLANQATTDTIAEGVRSTKLGDLLKQELEQEMILQVAIRGLFVNAPYPIFAAIFLKKDFRAALQDEEAGPQLIREYRYHRDALAGCEGDHKQLVDAGFNWMHRLADSYFGRRTESEFLTPGEVKERFGASPLATSPTIFCTPVQYGDAHLGVILLAHFEAKVNGLRPIDDAVRGKATLVAHALGAGLAHLLLIEQRSELGS